MTRYLILILVCSVMLIACRGPGATDEDPAGSSDHELTAVDAAGLLDKVAPRLPADTIGVAAASGELFGTTSMEDLLGSLLGDRFGPEQQAALEKDLSGFLLERIGVAPRELEWVLAAVGDSQWAGVFVGGDIEISEKLERRSVDGLEVIDFLEGSYLIPIDSPEAVLIVFKKQHLEAFAAAAGDAKQSLSESPRLERLGALLERAGTGALSAAVNLEDAKLHQKLTGKLPSELRGLSGAAVSISTELRVVVQGDEEAIGALEAFVDKGIDALVSEARSLHARLDDLDVGEGTLAIMAVHLAEPLAETLRPSFDGEWASLELSLPGGAGLIVPMVGVGAAVAVPAFVRYIRDSKTSEAEENLKSIGDGALVYYQEEHAAPDGLTVTTRQYPIQRDALCSEGRLDGAKSSPSATDWSAWRALRFTISKPHYYRYCYQSDGSSFMAWAAASLDGSGETDSLFSIEGSARDGRPHLSPPIEWDPREFETRLERRGQEAMERGVDLILECDKHMSEGDFEAGLRACKEALTLDPSSKLAQAKYERVVNEAEQMKRYTSALEYLNDSECELALIELDSITDENSFAARQIVVEGTRDGALVCLSNKLAERAEAALAELDIAAAEQTIAELERKVPSSTRLTELRAALATAQGKPAPAPVESPPESATAGESAEAQSFADEARKLVVSNPSKAARLYQQALEIEPKNATWRASYAFAMERAGKTCDAYEQYKKALAQGLSGKAKERAEKHLAEAREKCD